MCCIAERLGHCVLNAQNVCVCPVKGAAQCLLFVHVGNQDVGMPSRYLANTVSWTLCKD